MGDPVVFVLMTKIVKCSTNIVIIIKYYRKVP